MFVGPNDPILFDSFLTVVYRVTVTSKGNFWLLLGERKGKCEKNSLVRRGIRGHVQAKYLVCLREKEKEYEAKVLTTVNQMSPGKIQSVIHRFLPSFTVRGTDVKYKRGL